MNWIVELQEGCWLASWKGDPGRTLVKDNAKLFRSEEKARAALTKARKYHPFLNARVIDVRLAEQVGLYMRSSLDVARAALFG